MFANVTYDPYLMEFVYVMYENRIICYSKRVQI